MGKKKVQNIEKSKKEKEYSIPWRATGQVSYRIIDQRQWQNSCLIKNLLGILFLILSYQPKQKFFYIFLVNLFLQAKYIRYLHNFENSFPFHLPFHSYPVSNPRKSIWNLLIESSFSQLLRAKLSFFIIHVFLDCRLCNILRNIWYFLLLVHLQNPLYIGTWQWI